MNHFMLHFEESDSNIRFGGLRKPGDFYNILKVEDI